MAPKFEYSEPLKHVIPYAQPFHAPNRLLPKTSFTLLRTSTLIRLEDFHVTPMVRTAMLVLISGVKLSPPKFRGYGLTGLFLKTNL